MLVTEDRLVGRLGFILHDAGRIAAFDQIHRFGDCVYAQREQFVEVKTARGFVRGDGDFFLQQDRSGIDAFIEPENCKSGFTLAVKQRPVNRAAAAMSRQQGRVVTDAAEPRRAEYRRRNNLAYECKNPEVRVQCSDLLVDLSILECLRLIYRNSEGKRFLFNRIDFSTGRIGRTVDRQNLIAFANEFLQGFFTKCRLPDENDSHFVSPLSELQILPH